MKHVPIILAAVTVLATAGCATGPDYHRTGMSSSAQRVGSYGNAPRAGGDTVLLCHKGKKTMELPRAAMQGHLNHGDRLGRC